VLQSAIARSAAPPNSSSLERLIQRVTRAETVRLGERVQALWSGYGEVRRATLVGVVPAQVVVKYVVPRAPAGAKSSSPEARSHARKLRSYEVERAFYETYAARCGEACRVPSKLHVSSEGEQTLFVLEDLDAAGFSARRDHVSDSELRAGLGWLAAFHATFLNEPPQSLWKTGSYWHLGTRPDELQALRDRALQRAAPELDQRLSRARFRTFVHGDAKLQNFCFAPDGSAVAAVDFQYVGGGVGVKDLAYFLSSCLPSARLEREAESYLDDYFQALRQALERREYKDADCAALEAEWRELYPVACADFYRFLLGWAGEPDGRDRYLEAVTRAVLSRL
jgi:hypothetical protein